MVGESLKGHVGEAARKDDELTPYPVGCDNVYTVRLVQIGVYIVSDTIHGSHGKTCIYQKGTVHTKSSDGVHNMVQFNAGCGGYMGLLQCG